MEQLLILNCLKQAALSTRNLVCAFALAMSFNAIASEKPLVVALPDAGYPPYVIVNESKVTGILVESIKRASQNAGITMEFQFLPEKRSLMALQECSVDARMESALYSDAPDEYLWSHPIIEIEDVLIANNEDYHHIEDIEDLVGHELIAHIGYSYPALQSYFDSGTIIRSDRYNEREMLRSLLRPSPDSRRLAVMDRNVATTLFNNDNQLRDNLRFIELQLGKAPLQFQFCDNAENAKRAALLDEQLTLLKESGELLSIKKAFIPSNE